MQYLLMIYGNEAAMKSASEADTYKMSAAYGAYTEALKTAGVIRGGERLRPTSDATTVRVANGKSKVLNGPYAETKEQLNGFYIIDAKDQAEAATVAAMIPHAAYGSVEVRPILEMHGM